MAGNTGDGADERETASFGFREVPPTRSSAWSTTCSTASPAATT